MTEPTATRARVLLGTWVNIVRRMWLFVNQVCITLSVSLNLSFLNSQNKIFIIPSKYAKYFSSNNRSDRIT